MDKTVLKSANWKLKATLYKTGHIYLELINVFTNKTYQYKIVNNTLILNKTEPTYIS